MEKKTKKSPEKGMEVETNAPREWPTKAANARDRAAELLAEADRLLEGVIGGTLDLTKVMRAELAIKDALRHLESQGAPTRPQ